MKDYYDILGVPKDASQEDIKRAYHILASQYHPDKNNGNEKRFKEINEAYRILSLASSRAKYDKEYVPPKSEPVKEERVHNHVEQSKNKIVEGKYSKTFWLFLTLGALVTASITLKGGFFALVGGLFGGLLISKIIAYVYCLFSKVKDAQRQKNIWAIIFLITSIISATNNFLYKEYKQNIFSFLFQAKQTTTLPSQTYQQTSEATKQIAKYKEGSYKAFFVQNSDMPFRQASVSAVSLVDGSNLKPPEDYVRFYINIPGSHVWVNCAKDNYSIVDIESPQLKELELDDKTMGIGLVLNNKENKINFVCVPSEIKQVKQPINTSINVTPLIYVSQVNISELSAPLLKKYVFINKVMSTELPLIEEIYQKNNDNISRLEGLQNSKYNSDAAKVLTIIQNESVALEGVILDIKNKLLMIKSGIEKINTTGNTFSSEQDEQSYKNFIEAQTKVVDNLIYNFNPENKNNILSLVYERDKKNVELQKLLVDYLIRIE